MKSFVWCFGFFTFLFLSMSFVSSQVVTECGAITEPGYYELDSDFSPDASYNSAYCILFTSDANDVVFDGNGYTFENSSYQSSIFYVNYGKSNITLTNFSVDVGSDSHTILTSNGISDFEISYVNILNSGKLVYFAGCTEENLCEDILIHDNVVNSRYGIYAESLDGVKIYDNLFNTSSYSIYQRAQPSYYVEITNNQFYDSILYNAPIYDFLIEDNDFFEDGAITSTEDSVVAENLIIRENSFSVHGEYPNRNVIRTPGASNLLIEDNYFEDGEGFAIALQNVTNATVRNNYYYNQSKCIGTDLVTNGQSNHIDIRNEICLGKENYLTTYSGISSHGIITHSNDVNVTNCTVENMFFGYLTHNGSSNNYFKNNTARDVRVGIYVIDEAYDNVHENYEISDVVDYAIHFYRYSDRGSSYPERNLVRNVLVSGTSNGIGFTNISDGNNTAQDIVLEDVSNNCVTATKESVGGNLVNVSYSEGCYESISLDSSIGRYWYLDSDANLWGTNLTLYNYSDGHVLYSVLSPNWITQAFLAYVNLGGLVSNQTYLINASNDLADSQNETFNLTDNSQVNFIFDGGASGQSNLITGCGQISEPGYYEMATDIVPSNEYNPYLCIYIRSDDVIFDGNGYSFVNESFNDPVIYILDGMDNVTVRNFVVNVSQDSYSHGVLVGTNGGISNVEISNVTYLSSHRAAYFLCDETLCYNLSFVNNTGISVVTGLDVVGVNNLTIFGNQIDSSGSAVSFRTSPSSNINIRENHFGSELSSNVLLSSVEVEGLGIIDNLFSLGSSLSVPVSVKGASEVLISGNEFYQGDSYSIVLDNNSNVEVSGNSYFGDSKGVGVEVDSDGVYDSFNLTIRD